MPDDPTMLDVEGLPTLGCNRLHCSRCDVLVHQAMGPGDGGHRRYQCACSHWLEDGVQQLDDSDPEAFRASPSVPWTCAGHPRISLPQDIEGARVATRKDLEELVHQAIADGALPPRVHERDRAGAVWLARLHARLGAEDAALVVDVALACLVDRSPAARSRALALGAHVATTAIRLRVLELLVLHRALFEVDDETAPHRTLEERAWDIIEALVGAPGAAREQARADALGGRGCRALFSAIAAGDPAWFSANAVAMARATPSRAEDLYDAFAQLPDEALGDFGANRAAVRAVIAETLTLEAALLRTLHPLLAWDHRFPDDAHACVFEPRSWGAELIKAARVGAGERDAWNERVRQRNGVVGATHSERNVAWVFTDDRVGVWNATREVVRGTRRRFLLGGGYVDAGTFTRVTSFEDAHGAMPDRAKRGVRVTLADGNERVVCDEPRGAEGGAVWHRFLAADLARWLGVPHVDA